MIFVKKYVSYLSLGKYDARTRDIVSSGLIAKGNALFIHTSIALLALSNMDVDENILKAYQTSAITLAMVSAIINIPA